MFGSLCLPVFKKQYEANTTTTVGGVNAEGGCRRCAIAKICHCSHHALLVFCKCIVIWVASFEHQRLSLAKHSILRRLLKANCFFSR